MVAAALALWKRMKCSSCQRIVILNANFWYVYQETANQTSVEMKKGVLQDERVNPNSFVERCLQPIVDTLQRLGGTTAWRVDVASWAEGLARIEATKSTGRDVVDVGSSKCLRLRLEGEGVRHVAKSPSITEPMAVCKCADFGITHTEGEGGQALVQKQYMKLLPFLLDCARDQVQLVSTEGVRSFCRAANLPTHELSVQALLAAPQNPMSALHANASACDVAALTGLPVVVLSGEDEGRLECADALGKMKLGGVRTEGAGRVVFVSMGGASTQVVVCDRDARVHGGIGDLAQSRSVGGRCCGSQLFAVRSFQVGKAWFRQGEAAIDAALKELGALQAFVREHACS
jgi:hypothetical protein